ncbi:MAG: hypothetical protein KKC76_14770 [Proteobacteria bacterium]|nr:hypothetical protein [Pseudomonadota bacterium]MBU4294320.1 hypothetical protein [Pseudomonadota bacterium]MCG2749107.1 hypothetical protein [Desulfobulbaceae bacterium]
MNSSERHRTAGEYVEWLRLALHEREIPANDRVRAAASCLAIAQDHHHAIVVLIEHRLYASSFALLRIAFEAYLRGEWLALCAKDSEIRRFLKGWEPPRVDTLLHDLEEPPAFSEQVLSNVKQKLWSVMCAYTHTGGLHVQRWNTVEAVEPAYAPEEVDEVLTFAEIIASLSVIGVANLAQDEDLANSVFQRFISRTA